MIISTHFVFGAVSSQVLALGPVGAFTAGFLSHFILDSIPHWDYKLDIESKGFSLKSVTKDALRISMDLLSGVLAVFLIIKFLILNGDIGSFHMILWFGGLGAIFPDFMRNLAIFKKFKFLSSFKSLHDQIHSKIEFKNWYNDWPQLLVIALILISIWIFL